MADNEIQEIQNKVTVTDSGACKKKVSVEIPQEKIEQVKKNDYDELRREAVIPGFRKGKAPMRLLEKRFGSDIQKQVKVKLLAEATESAIKDENIDMIGSEPDVDVDAIEMPESGPLKFEFEVEVRPEFELPKLENIPVEKPKTEITDQQVDQEVEELRKNAGVWKPAEGAKAEKDDQVIAEVKIVIDGNKENAKTEGAQIFVRETGMVAGVPVSDLDKLLEGVKAGDTKKTSVDIPKTFYNEELRDKKVDLEIKVEDIKKLEPAELNEGFFSRFGVKDLDELKNSIREHAEDMVERQIRTAMAEDIRSYLLENTDFDLPGDIVADQSARLLQRQYINMMMQGMDREKIEQQMEQLRTSSEEQAIEQLKMFFIMDKVADELKVEVDESEVNNYIAQVAAQRGRRPEKMREDMIKDGSLAQFTLQVREDKCIQQLLEKADIKEVEAKSKTPKKKKTAKNTAKKDAEKETESQEKKKTAKKQTDKE